MDIRHSRWLILGAVGALLLAALFAVDHSYRLHLQEQVQARETVALTIARSELEHGVRLRETISEDLAAFLLTSLPHSNQTLFNRYAESVLSHSPQIRALEYVGRDNTIRYAFPLKGNEAAVDIGLKNRPSSSQIRRSIRRRATTVSEPVVTAPGSLSIVIRTPIYTGDEYLGMAQAVCDVSALLERVSTSLAPEFALRVYDNHGVNIWSTKQYFGPSAQTSVQVGDVGWTLSVRAKAADLRPALVVLALIWGAGLIFASNVLVWLNRTLRRIRGLSETVERKTADLVASERRYRTLVETADDMILQLAPDGTLLFANDAYRRIAGGRVASGQRNDVSDPAAPEDVGKLLASLPALLENGPQGVEYAVSGPNGEPSYRYARINLIRDANGKSQSILAIIRDITDQKKLEEQAAKLQASIYQAQKMDAVGRLSAGIAHDFNNMFMVINGNAELLRLRFQQDSRLSAMIDDIIRAGSRAADLIGQLLSFSRKKFISPEVISLNRELEQTKEILERVIPENIEIRLILADDLWNVEADASQIEEIVLNLAQNGRDAMPNGGILALETGNEFVTEPRHDEYGELKPGEYVVLKVSDTGSGMGPEVMLHLFEPFYTTKELNRGTGLGLATVYGIVQQSRGHISVASTVGTGSVFTLYLPRSTAPVTDRLVIAETGTAVSTRETVLLAEDDFAIRRLAKDILVERGYRVLEAQDGAHALRIATDYPAPIHILLTDVVMPRMDGKTLAARLAAVHPGLKVIFMSGYSDELTSTEANEQGPTMLLRKPFTLVELLETVRMVLAR